MQNESDPFLLKEMGMCTRVSEYVSGVPVPVCARVDTYMIYTADTATRAGER